MDNVKSERTLNPFALPPETNARFNLLLVSVIVLSLILGNYLPVYFLSEGDTDKFISPKVDHTNAEINTAEDLKDSGYKMISNSLEYLPSVLISLFIFSAIYIFSYYLYRRHAKEIIYKKNLKKADNTDGKYFRLTNDIKNITSVYGAEEPEIFIAPDFTTGAQAFGFKNKNMLRIDNGLRMMAYKNFKRFKAIVLHETGHIINKDVSKTYMARSLWKAVLYIFAVPTLLIILISFSMNIFKKVSKGLETEDLKKILLESIPSFLLLTVSITLFFLLIYLLLKSLVRTREYYADRRAADAGSKEDLDQMFRENSKKEKRTGYLKSIFRWHPDPQERSKVLDDPTELFTLRNDIGFIVGLLLPFSIFSFIILIKTGLTFTGLLSGAGQVISQNMTFTLLSVIFSILIFIVFCFVPFFITSYLISSSLGLQIQKNVIASLSEGKISFTFTRIFSTAFIITCGMAAGSVLIPYFSVLNVMINSSFSDFIFEKIPLIILSFVMAYTVNFLWIIYVKFFTGKIYGRYVKTKPPLKRFYIFNVVSALLLSVMILPVAGTFFRIYSDKITLLNEITDTLLFAVPVIYIFFFTLTGLISAILNSADTGCPHCSKPLPKGNLLGKECENCGSVFSSWLYI